MPSYSPFESDFRDLKSQDLAALKAVAEGWYVEYKREVPPASSIAKSVSAFANTYGGWLFYGIVEKSKEEAVAGTFSGIPRSELDAALQRIQQAVATQLAPSPHYDLKILYGFDEGTDLAADHGIICIQIPQGNNAPYTHKDGRIYRRVSDGSDPKPETDRYLLEQLWRRGDRLIEYYRRWVLEEDPEFSKAESRWPYLRIMLVADLWNDQDSWTTFSVEEVRSIFTNMPSEVSSLPFENVHTSPNGFICRQMKGLDPGTLGLVWKLDYDLRSDILIPLNLIECGIGQLEKRLNGYQNAGRFIRLLREYEYGEPRIVDINMLFGLLSGISRIYVELCEKAKWRSSLFGKFKLLNAWRTVPFIDVDSVIEYEEKHGLCMNMDSSTLIFPGFRPNSFVEFDIESEKGALTKEFALAMLMFGHVAHGFGLPRFIDYDSSEYAGRHFYGDLGDATNRAIARQNILGRRK